MFNEGEHMFLEVVRQLSLLVCRNAVPYGNVNQSNFARKMLNIANTVLQPCTVYAAKEHTPSLPWQYGFSYRDSSGLNKQYVSGETRLIEAKYTPFESDIINHLTGNKSHEKVKIRVTSSAVKVPMDGMDGNTYLVRSDFVHYRGPGGQVTILPNGDVDTSDDQHMKRNMLPGMQRKAGDFAVYEIPEEKMSQRKRGEFSSFSLLREY
jgi:hypothetical protein